MDIGKLIGLINAKKVPRSLIVQIIDASRLQKILYPAIIDKGWLRGRVSEVFVGEQGAYPVQSKLVSGPALGDSDGIDMLREIGISLQFGSRLQLFLLMSGIPSPGPQCLMPGARRLTPDARKLG